MMNVMGGRLAADDGLNSIIRRFDVPLPQLSPDQALNTLSGTAVEVFAENNPLESNSKIPFGQLAMDLTIELLTKENFPIEATALDNVPSTIPILAEAENVSVRPSGLRIKRAEA
jgi:hypothetical protein